MAAPRERERVKNTSAGKREGYKQVSAVTQIEKEQGKDKRTSTAKELGQTNYDKPTRKGKTQDDI